MISSCVNSGSSCPSVSWYLRHNPFDIIHCSSTKAVVELSDSQSGTFPALKKSKTHHPLLIPTNSIIEMEVCFNYLAYFSLNQSRSKGLCLRYHDTDGHDEPLLTQLDIIHRYQKQCFMKINAQHTSFWVTIRFCQLSGCECSGLRRHC